MKTRGYALAGAISLLSLILSLVACNGTHYIRTSTPADSPLFESRYGLFRRCDRAVGLGGTWRCRRYPKRQLDCPARPAKHVSTAMSAEGMSDMGKLRFSALLGLRQSNDDLLDLETVRQKRIEVEAEEGGASLALACCVANFPDISHRWRQVTLRLLSSVVDERVRSLAHSDSIFARRYAQLRRSTQRRHGRLRHSLFHPRHDPSYRLSRTQNARLEARRRSHRSPSRPSTDLDCHCASHLFPFPLRSPPAQIAHLLRTSGRFPDSSGLGDSFALATASWGLGVLLIGGLFWAERAGVARLEDHGYEAIPE